MKIPPETLDWARQLIAREAVAGKPSESTESAALLVYGKLRYALSRLVGFPAFRSLASRALMLAKKEVPHLSAARVTEDGMLQGLVEPEPRVDKGQDGQGGVILIARLLGLLCAFIGVALTVRLIQDLWQDAAQIDPNSGTREKDEHTR